MVHARDFVPSWAAAVVIDLMPIVLLVFLIMAAHAEWREEETGGSQADPDKVTRMSSYR